MPVQRRAGRDRALAQLGLPVPVRRGRVDLAEDDVDHPVEEVGLAGDVVVERHRLDPELLGELAHRQLLGPTLVGQRDGGAQDPVAVERGPSRQRLLRRHRLSRRLLTRRSGALRGAGALDKAYDVSVQRSASAYSVSIRSNEGAADMSTRSPMITLTRWVLGHKALVVAVWVTLAVAGVAASGPA